MADSTTSSDATNDNSERTVYVGNIHQNVTDDLLFELFVQVFDQRILYNFLPICNHWHESFDVTIFLKTYVGTSLI